MKFRGMTFRRSVRLIWTEWYFGIWWWPVKKDRAFGFAIGPIHVHWERVR